MPPPALHAPQCSGTATAPQSCTGQETGSLTAFRRVGKRILSAAQSPETVTLLLWLSFHFPHHSLNICTRTPPNRLGHPQTTTPPAGAPLGPSQGSQGPSLFLGGLTTSWRSPGVVSAAAAGTRVQVGGGHVTGRGAGRRAPLHPSCLLPLLTPQLSQHPPAFVPDGR